MSYDKELEKYLKEYQDNPYSRVFAPLAEAYRKNGMPQEAVEICLEGIKQHPDFISGKVALARAYTDLKEYDKARNVLEEVVDQAPDNYLASSLLADIYFKLGELKDSLKVYTYILSIHPEDKQAKLRIKEIEDTLNREPINTEESEEDNDEELPPPLDIPPHPYEIIPDFVPPAFELTTDNDFETKKTEDLFKVAEPDSNNEVVQELASESMAELLLEQGHKEEALKVYKKLQNQEPENEILTSKITELELDLGLVKIPSDEDEEKTTEYVNDDDVLGYAYDEDSTNITVIPPPFSSSDIDTDTEDFKTEALGTLTDKKNYTELSDIVVEEEKDLMIGNNLVEDIIKSEKAEEENLILENTEENNRSNEELDDNTTSTESIKLKPPKLSINTEESLKQDNDSWIIPNKKLYKLEQMLENIKKMRKTL